VVSRDVATDARFLCDKPAVFGGHIKERPVYPILDKSQNMYKTKKINMCLYIYEVKLVLALL